MGRGGEKEWGKEGKGRKDEERVQVTTNRLVGAGRREEPQHIGVTTLTSRGSREVIDHVTIR